MNMREVTVAAIQMSCTSDKSDNLDKATALVLAAAAKGAQIILLQELFETPYFCQKPLEKYIPLATSAEENPAIKHFSKIARENKIVLPVSFFERDNNACYNSVAVIDADGEVLGIYRKSHIPDGAGYQEKFFFNPGDTGFKVWDTAYGRIGIGICWDQWFPETARCLALMGAELLFFPTAIGSEPLEPTINSRAHWQTVMQGHAAANIMPVIASNRIGTEYEDESFIRFYGSSFIADEHGQIVQGLDEENENVCTATFDLDEIALLRRSWGIFRDRRPDLYKTILTNDGHTQI
jgi:N-carbamoylputrescine amidase